MCNSSPYLRACGRVATHRRRFPDFHRTQGSFLLLEDSSLEHLVNCGDAVGPAADALSNCERILHKIALMFPCHANCRRPFRQLCPMLRFPYVLPSARTSIATAGSATRKTFWNPTPFHAPSVPRPATCCSRTRHSTSGKTVENGAFDVLTGSPISSPISLDHTRIKVLWIAKDVKHPAASQTTAFVSRHNEKQRWCLLRTVSPAPWSYGVMES